MNFPDPNLPAIVVVDDSQDDAFLLRYRLRLGGVANPVVTFESTLESIAYLHGTRVVNALPEFLFVDIKMPGGAELIAEIREHAEFDDMKVVVLTYSNDAADLQHALELRINGYLLKFPDSDTLAEFVHRGPWFSISRKIQAAPHALCA